MTPTCSYCRQTQAPHHNKATDIWECPCCGAPAPEAAQVPVAGLHFRFMTQAMTAPRHNVLLVGLV